MRSKSKIDNVRGVAAGEKRRRKEARRGKKRGAAVITEDQNTFEYNIYCTCAAQM